METKKKWRVKPKIVNWIFRFISFVLFCYILGMLFFPDTMINLTGFQFYTVLSGSMEPKIPTYSLVLSKNIKSDDELVPGTIITFHANRLGEDTVLTHTLAKTEVESDGRVRIIRRLMLTKVWMNIIHTGRISSASMSCTFLSWERLCCSYRASMLGSSFQLWLSSCSYHGLWNC